ncbi:MAG: hypothetical protein PHR26_03430 [Candidatus ainarchaeum sp.]|nr:hypothetical protein [Candidatus ainarchaeum sp.]MDD3976027.1 hypothetical protein [Candidatus ainarchaeum sp.]
MKETIIGIIKNVQAKGKNTFIKKNCDLYFTNKRIICIILSESNFISGMTGGLIAGVSGIIALSQITDYTAKDKRSKNKEKELDFIIYSNPNSFEIKNNDIIIEKSKLETRFIKTFRIFAQLIIKTKSKKYFFDIPYQYRYIAKIIISKYNNKLKIN